MAGSPRPRRRRLRNALRRSKAAAHQLAAYPDSGAARYVDLGRHVRPESSCAARQVVSCADRADDRHPDRARRRRDHRGELLPQRRVRLRYRPGWPTADPACVHPGAVSPVRRAGIRGGGGHTSRPVDGGRRTLGSVLVRAFPQHRRRRHDDLLRRRAVPAHRHEDRLFETRQAGRHRGGRGYRGGDMHSSLCPGPRRAAYARIVCALHLHSRRHPLRRRANVAGRRDGGG